MAAQVFAPFLAEIAEKAEPPTSQGPRPVKLAFAVDNSGGVKIKLCNSMDGSLDDASNSEGPCEACEENDTPLGEVSEGEEDLDFSES